jgi:hypothetical protein
VNIRHCCWSSQITFSEKLKNLLLNQDLVFTDIRTESDTFKPPMEFLIHVFGLRYVEITSYRICQQFSDCDTGAPWGTRDVFQGYHKSSFIYMHTTLIKSKL